MNITLFVSVDTVREILGLDKSISDKQIQYAILRAQDTSLENILTTPLYNKIAEDIDNDSLSDDYITLVDEYIAKYLTQLTGYTLYSSMAIVLKDAGVVRRSSDKYENATLEELNFARQDLKSAARAYEKRLIDYVTKSNFAEYDTTPDKGDAEVQTKAFSGYFIDKGDWNNDIVNY